MVSRKEQMIDELFEIFLPLVAVIGVAVIFFLPAWTAMQVLKLVLAIFS